MKKLSKQLFALILIGVLAFLAGCGNTKPLELPEHKTMQASIIIPDDAANMTKAYYLSVDVIVNMSIDNVLKFKPEFISFNLTSNIVLNQSERDTMLELFKVYGTTVDDRGLNPPKRAVEERAKGIIVGFPSSVKYQTSDCDLTIPIDIYFGSRVYTYNCDFNIENGKYVLFRAESVYQQKYEW